MSETPAPDPLRAVLLKLVPEGNVVVLTTVAGDTLRLNTSISARKQIVVARATERLLRRSVVAGTIASAKGGGRADLFGQIVGLINDDAALDELAAAFLAAYPDALPAGVHPLDALSIEEVVLAILPLLVRPMLRALDVVGPLGVGILGTGQGTPEA